MKKILIFILIAILFSGCYTMKAVAPAGEDVKILSEDDTTSYKKKVRVWYALWGLVKISDNTASDVIRDNNLKEARVTTKHEFVDYLIGIFTGIASIVPATMIVEGNQQSPANE